MNHKLSFPLWFKSFLIVLCFALPFFIAFYLYSNRHDLHFSRNNKGDLIQPPIPSNVVDFMRLHQGVIQMSQLPGQWRVIDWQLNCLQTHADQQRLFFLRQLHVALGHEGQGVQNVLLQPQRCYTPAFLHTMQQAYPQVLLLSLSHWQQSQWLQRWPLSLRQQYLQQGGIYLVDSKGWLMMHYRLPFKPEQLFSDIRHLLRMSYAS